MVEVSARPRESGDPEVGLFRTGWIPAYAGMSGKRSVNNQEAVGW
jgi:hypothetical protein